MESGWINQQSLKQKKFWIYGWTLPYWHRILICKVILSRSKWKLSFKYFSLTVLVKATLIFFLKRCSFFDETSEKKLLFICHFSQGFQKKNLFDIPDSFFKSSTYWDIHLSATPSNWNRTYFSLKSIYYNSKQMLQKPDFHVSKFNIEYFGKKDS